MLKIFDGEDRVTALKAIERLLGKEYESIDGVTLSPADMASVFMGVSIFSDKRKILVKNLSENTDCWNELIKYIETPHEIIIWNLVTNKKLASTKELMKAGVDFKRFEIEEKDKFVVLDMVSAMMSGRFDEAKRKFLVVRTKNESAVPVFAAITTNLCNKYFGKNRKTEVALKILAKYESKTRTHGLDEWQALEIAVTEICLK